MPEGEITKRVISVPEAGRALGLSRNSSYEAAARGEIPDQLDWQAAPRSQGGIRPAVGRRATRYSEGSLNHGLQTKPAEGNRRASRS